MMSIKAIDLDYTYGPGTAFEHHVLKHVNFEIKDGEFVGLIGHTGSGKSTTLAAVLNEINHTAFKHILTLEDTVE